MAELHFEYFVNVILFLQQSGSLLTFIYRCIYLQTKIFIKKEHEYEIQQRVIQYAFGTTDQ